jgi:hypothetical protein
MRVSHLGPALVVLALAAGLSLAQPGTKPPASPDSASLKADAATNVTELLDYALVQWRSRPEIRAQDAYKWLFQATQGGEHGAGDMGLGTFLEEEWGQVGAPRQGEAPAESLRADGSLLRINLRPFKAAGGRQEVLLAAFIQSIGGFRPDKKLFEDAWSELGRRLQAGPVGKLQYDQWKDLDSITRPRNYPPLHHSNQYQVNYAPAYRVVLARVWREKTAVVKP